MLFEREILFFSTCESIFDGERFVNCCRRRLKTSETRKEQKDSLPFLLL